MARGWLCWFQVRLKGRGDNSLQRTARWSGHRDVNGLYNNLGDAAGPTGLVGAGDDIACIIPEQREGDG